MDELIEVDRDRRPILSRGRNHTALRAPRRLTTSVLALGLWVAAAVPLASGRPTHAERAEPVVVLTNEDFRFGTYVIDRPGTYRLGEDISFNPNSPYELQAAVDAGVEPGAVGLELPIDAYQAGFPLRSQFAPGGVARFTPGGVLDARYDPAAYGVGFFAAISVTADDVVIDLAGRRIEQSAEHALLQRFFAVIELADQPFLPSQGPFDFGDEIDAANRVTIRNGTIGRSSHHGVHGNHNTEIAIHNVDFDGYEVAAVALNGVRGLDVRNVTATNRKDLPVLGTFSSAQFIKPYIDRLARTGATTELAVGGVALDVGDVRAALRSAINTTHASVLSTGRVSPTDDLEYGLFHNPHGVVDGNSYSFLINHVGVAVGGFPLTPDPAHAAARVRLSNVHVTDQVAAINEVPAVDVDGAAATDPIGAVFQTQNRHPDTHEPLTISPDGRYTGNPVANAQALVARAAEDGEFAGSHLSTSRLSIGADILDWIEQGTTLAESGIGYLCNGDSMFHVNKGVIAFRMDAARDVELVNTSVDGLVNLGAAGSEICGDYVDGTSHPGATLPGYGGSVVRAYTFAGSQQVSVRGADVRQARAHAGPVIGFDVLTDSADIDLVAVTINHLTSGQVPESSPTPPAAAYGVHVGGGADQVTVVASCASDLSGADGHAFLHDESGTVTHRAKGGGCRP